MPTEEELEQLVSAHIDSEDMKMPILSKEIEKKQEGVKGK